ncbi:MAG: sigma-70 family RNA polymerase sigma factor [Bacteroidales bacterium]|nr:sigma-70 family RNA polymerase sigma factor [Bacteroidales bacterium]
MRYYSVKEPDTFNGLIHRYSRLIYSVCRHYEHGGVEFDDLLQETMIALWNLRDKLLSISPAPKQAVWIWRVARSTCVDTLRRTPKTVPFPSGYDTPCDDTTLHKALHESIAMLPEPDHTIASMYLEGYDYKEIGKKTSMTKNNVGIRLIRIKDKLRKQWNNE